MRIIEKKVLDYINASGNNGVTTADIQAEIQAESFLFVFEITRRLRDKKLIQGEFLFKELHWLFFPIGVDLPETFSNPYIPSKPLYEKFQILAWKAFSRLFGSNLQPREIFGVPMLLEMVSEDNLIVGDLDYRRIGELSYHELLEGKEMHESSIFSGIEEKIWLISKTNAEIKFFVFGPERQVADFWLDKYGHLTGDIKFFYMTESGEIENLYHLSQENFQGESFGSMKYDIPIWKGPPEDFRNRARLVLGDYFGCSFLPGRIPGIPYQWDMVSEDTSIIGQAGFYKIVPIGQTKIKALKDSPRSAIFTSMGKSIWLMSKIAAEMKFFVFGNDREIAEFWVKSFGHLCDEVEFFFMNDTDEIEKLTR